MKMIADIIEMINDELDGAEEYAEMANKLKDDDPEHAKVYYDMSLDEMAHTNNLHKIVADEIAKYRRELGDPPASMQAVYDWEHKKYIERAAEVKAMQNVYKGV